MKIPTATLLLVAAATAFTLPARAAATEEQRAAMKQKWESMTPEQKAAARERIKERWDSMMKGDVEKAYEYLSPASRETLSKQNYLRRRAGGRYWRSVTIPKVECAADLCKVSIELVYDLSPDLKGLKREFVETWILDGGTWWLVQDK